jgi:hypothetical protein
MPWSFRKRVKIAPGVTVNLSKNGITGGRVGSRNVGLSVGKRGTHVGASLPGTGLSVRHRLDGATGEQVRSTRRGPSWQLVAAVIIALIALGLIVALVV